MKEFDSNNYTIATTFDSVGATETTGYYSYVNAVTTTGFNISTYRDTYSRWYATGQGAED